MMVACLSEYDPTRIRPYLANGKPSLNPFLSMRGCSYLFSQLASGKLLAPPKPAAKASAQATPAKETKVAAGQKVTLTNTTVTENAGPPFIAVAAPPQVNGRTDRA